jgi:hypothetical protein
VGQSRRAHGEKEVKDEWDDAPPGSIADGVRIVAPPDVALDTDKKNVLLNHLQ